MANLPSLAADFKREAQTFSVLLPHRSKKGRKDEQILTWTNTLHWEPCETEGLQLKDLSEVNCHQTSVSNSSYNKHSLIIWGYFELFSTNSCAALQVEPDPSLLTCHPECVCMCVPDRAPVCASWALSPAPEVRWNAFSLLAAFLFHAPQAAWASQCRGQQAENIEPAVCVCECSWCVQVRVSGFQHVCVRIAKKSARFSTSL